MRLKLGLRALGTMGTVALAACGTGDKFAPACPTLSLLHDATDLTRYAGSGHDVSDLSLTARIVAVPANCVRNDGHTVKATLKVAIDVTRGPAARSRTADVPYFVAVTEGDRVLDEQDYSISAQFPSNIDTIQLTSADIDLLLPVTKDKSAAAYQVYAGFRLSSEELTANRERARR